MGSLMQYIRRNLMFVVILMIIIAITAAIVIYQLLIVPASLQEGVQDSPNAPQHVDEADRDTAIVGFQARLSKDDVIVLSWEIDQGDQSVVSSALYYVDPLQGDVWIADVTNHSGYQLAQDAYQFAGGENTFKIVCTLADDEQIEAETSVNILQLTDVQFEREDVEGGIRLYLHYGSTSNAAVDAPILSFYGNGAGAFSAHYEGISRNESEGTVRTTVVYLLKDDNAPSGNYQFTLNFQFLQLNKAYEYTVDYEKQAEDVPAQEENDE